MRTSLAVCLLAIGAAVALPPTAATAKVDVQRYIGSYHSEAGCQQAARKGESEGRWRTHTCVKSMYRHLGTWDLWVR